MYSSLVGQENGSEWYALHYMYIHVYLVGYTDASRVDLESDT